MRPASMSQFGKGTPEGGGRGKSRRVWSLLYRFALTTGGVWAAASIVDGIRAETVIALVGAALILGLLNAFLRPVLLLLSLPLLLVTLGLFTVVVNAVLLSLVSAVVKGFHVASFWTAIKGAVVISLVSFFLDLLFGRPWADRRLGRPGAGASPNQQGGSGKIIDV